MRIDGVGFQFWAGFITGTARARKPPQSPVPARRPAMRPARGRALLARTGFSSVKIHTVLPWFPSRVRRIVLFALMLWLGGAQGEILLAQIAATGLDQGMPRVVVREITGLNRAGITSENPAAQFWSGPSRAGAGALQLAVLDRQTHTERRFKGGFAGLRLVGSTMAFGVDVLNYEEDTGSPAFSEQVSAFNFSAKITDFLAWGIGKVRTSVSNDATEQETDAIVLGLSQKIYGLFFLGVAMGNEAIEEQKAGMFEHFGRDTRMFGGGFRYHGAYRFYFEANLLIKDDFSNSPDRDERLESLGATLQVGSTDFLLGVSVRNIVYAGQFRFDQTTLDFGYSPLNSLSIGSRFSILNHGATPSATASRQTTLSLGIAYLF